ncbi:MAG: ATP-dependent Clp protease ATP-binding subunit [Parcubacteria group bacterium]|nr:ATP-dependent Clp protease ATP-binding subunit [Parcubacteria group bacterium]
MNKQNWKRGRFLALDPTLQSTVSKDWIAFAREYVVGQERYIGEVGRALERGTSGLRDPNKPITCIFVAGPSRVGKTLVPKVLARFLFDDPKGMLRLEGQDFSQSHAVESLTGSPHGYVGYDDEPILTQEKLDAPALRAKREEFLLNLSDAQKKKVKNLEWALNELKGMHRQKENYDMSDAQTRKIFNKVDISQEETVNQLRQMGYPMYDPDNEAYFSIFLIDEIGRAHKTLENILFKILDEGEIVSKKGKKISFINSLIFLTSNEGSEEITGLLNERSGGRVRIGIRSQRTNKDLSEGEDREIYNVTMDAVRKRYGTPFLNRVKVIVARPLNKELLYGILRIQIKDLHERFLYQGCPLIIKISARVKAFLVQESLDKPEENAALLIEKLKNYVEEKLVLFVVTKQVKEGDVVIVTLKSQSRKELRFQKISQEDPRKRKTLVLPPVS